MRKPHPYLPNSAPQIKGRILKEIGIGSIDDLYSDIPEGLRFTDSLEILGPLPESEVRRTLEGILRKNREFVCPPFLGGGVWPHYVPAVVDEIVHRAEFLTSYTPYQPEISQGMLQALFEYQSLICELVGLDAANSSMYDWATALGEAARMASRLTRRNEFLVPALMHPERLQVLRSYAEPAGIRVVKVGYDHETGQMDLEDLAGKVSRETAGVYVENPSYLGFVEEKVEEIAEMIHERGGLFVVGVDPISLGLLRPPGDYGADIVVGEGQPLGNHMNYGGPLLGIFACRGDLRMVRQMPGRVVGLTTTLEGGRRGFCITLQTREQHIRRERATSNICTNEALCAVAAAVYLSLLGPEGLRDLCKLIVSRSHYAMRRLSKLPGVRVPLFNSFHFKEFTLRLEGLSYREVHEGLFQRGIHGGKYLGGEFPELGETALFCVTEVHSKGDIDRLVEAMGEVVG